MQVDERDDGVDEDKVGVLRLPNNAKI